MAVCCVASVYPIHDDAAFHRLRIHLEQMHANEMERRIAIRKRFGASLLEDIVTPEQATTERIMCAQCKTLSYLSQVVVVDDFTAAEIAYCTETTDVCIHKRPTSTSIVLRLTYSDADLARVVARVTETLAPMQKWIKRYRHYIASHPTVDVATIKRFLAEANRLQITVGDEVADVKRRVSAVTDWHVRVQRAVATRKRTRLGDAMQATTVRDLEGLLEEAREKGWESGDIGRLHEAIKALVGEWVNEVSEMVRVVRDPPPPKGQRGGGRKKVVKEKAGNVVTASTTVAPSEVVASATNNLLMTEDPASSTLNFSDVLVATAEDMWTGSVNVPSQQEPCTVTTPTQTPTPTSISPESSSSSSATAAVVDPLLDEMTILNVQQCKQLIDTATRLAIPTDHPVLVRLTEQVGLDATAATELSFSGEDADAALSAFDFAFATTSHGHAQ